MPIRFDDHVAIVTGAGGGLGRAYALALASRGARVVVNDLGVSSDGTGSSDAATQVVEEISAAGGQAMANGADVADYDQVTELVAGAKERWGGVHILINNAGVLRDKTFAKMDPADFEFVVRVHLLGSAFVTKACWDGFRDQNYGRVLMTASSSGLFGNFGQANYAAAKMGVVGLAKTLHLEGARHDIRVNTIAPTAGTRMTQGLLPDQAFDAFSPERVTPAALFLVSRDAPSGQIVGAGAGVVQASYVTLTPGVALSDDDLTPDAVADHWGAIASREREIIPTSGGEQAMLIGRTLADAGRPFA
ncbi:SDR family NAD(P)-dependent oxidoreductase [Sphingomonas aerophila]|uniref:NAD(P)-dependent dehydrogenase (Short-subunit alcohol dehydrogenase family) n=1 Tax=Sphingomonas aerophila TaxID=1344948 RepID=A0A7W9BCM3_9SPHN|nr:SDR family NAD(P)-dependent oxidoreductase [Sphingomonas aerophila]MBB5714416.1 NAD(P)-dependent dehydrogenase (short-subunit alcohol dehydrogenase family) [Sphingomonas aerophila]